jgi:hypothetical protein
MAVLIRPDMHDFLIEELFSSRRPTRLTRANLVDPAVFVESVAVELLPDDNGIEPRPLVDTDLKQIVAACLASDYTQRPRLIDLHNLVVQAAQQRTSQYYNMQNFRLGRPKYAFQRETEERVKIFSYTLMLNPATSGAADT